MDHMLKLAEPLFSRRAEPAKACEVHMLHCLVSLHAINTVSGQAGERMRVSNVDPPKAMLEQQ